MPHEDDKTTLEALSTELVELESALIASELRFIPKLLNFFGRRKKFKNGDIRFDAIEKQNAARVI